MDIIKNTIKMISDGSCNNMPRLTIPDRNRILGLLESGAKISHIATRFGVNRSTIQRLQLRYDETGTADDRQDNARPHTARVTTSFLNDNNIDVLPWPAQVQ